ncbi:MAG: GNAT family N-acetyltransferase [Oscillospiraceae bacterium]|nr:GNAT family N-acetyltransferase [Oscillospiraceae bacterium]
MNYELSINSLCAKDFIRLREAVGWGIHPDNQAEEGLKNSLFTVTAIHNNQVIGMGRLVGDGFMICYIQDLIVLPEYQGEGIGATILERLLAYIIDNAIPNTCVTDGLFSAKDKEEFYEKFGFHIRPNDNRGAGMEMGVKSKL